MAMLKDLLVSGPSRFIGKLFANDVQLTTLNIPTTSGGTTYGPGTNGQYLRTNATSVYWDTLDASDIPNISTDKLTSGTLPIARGGTGLTSSPSILVNLASTTAVNVLQATPRPGVTGTLAVGNGGTGKTSWTQWGVVYASAGTALTNTAAGTAGYLLQGNGAAAPSWIEATNANTASTIVKRDANKNFSANTITLSGDLAFSGSGKLDWNNGTFQQRLNITDDSTANTAVYEFQQSEDSGSTYKNLFTIKDNGNGLFYGGLEIRGHIAGDSGSAGYGLYSGGGYHNAYNNIILHGDATTGSSGIAFVSDKVSANGATITNVNQPSDRAFIQYHANGVTTYTAEGTAPTLTTSGEAGKFIIGIGNDAGDQLRLQTPARVDLLHQIGANAYVIPDTNNTTGTVGSSTGPVYVNAGAITACGSSLAVSITGNAATATKATQDGSGNTITSTYVPFSGGTMTNSLTMPSGKYFIGALNGNASSATKATQDGNGANIANTYLKKSGGTMTGALTVKGLKGTSAVDYGENLPSSPTEGQIFFQLSSEQYELPAGGATGTLLMKKSSSDRDVQWTPAAVYVSGSVLYGAAWNDYAEFRSTVGKVEPGRVVIENGDDTLSLSTERLQSGAEIVSDTFGFAIGQTEKCNTPIAASGRVLAYPNEPRDTYKPGQPVCSGPNGTVSQMTDEEARNYPWLILGTVSAIPDYETWGEDNIEVKGRIWVRIR